MANYITYVKDPAAREIFTRLRIDMNLLTTSKAHGHQNDTLCFLCRNECETVSHFVCRCSKFSEIRDEIFNLIAQRDTNFCSLTDNEKVVYILGLRCHEDVIGLCCKLLVKLYKLRDELNVLRFV